MHFSRQKPDVTLSTCGFSVARQYRIKSAKISPLCPRSLYKVALYLRTSGQCSLGWETSFGPDDMSPLHRLSTNGTTHSRIGRGGKTSELFLSLHVLSPNLRNRLEPFVGQLINQGCFARADRPVITCEFVWTPKGVDRRSRDWLSGSKIVLRTIRHFVILEFTSEGGLQ